MRGLFVIMGRLPWWLYLPCGIGAYVAFRHLLLLIPQHGSVTNMASMADLAIMTILRLVCNFLQYAVPLTVGLLALRQLLRGSPRSVYRKVSRSAESQSALESITWLEFEQLVGETFRRQGFSAQETIKGADGGVDLVLARDGARYLVQCKQWKSAKVGVSTVRELYGVMAAQSATGGFVVTSGEFTKTAVAFAKGRNIRLVGGSVLIRWMRDDQGRGMKSESIMNGAYAPTLPQVDTSKCCPLCMGVLVKRTVRKGSRAGSEFLGCTAYPHCPGTRPL